MTDPLHTYRARQAAGWTTRNGTGWWSPHCGPDGKQLSEADWVAEGWPLPEDPGYAAWYSATFHYDALDAGLLGPDPFPCGDRPVFR
jgi:hypothetical protein